MQSAITADSTAGAVEFRAYWHLGAYYLVTKLEPPEKVVTARCCGHRGGGCPLQNVVDAYTSTGSAEYLVVAVLFIHLGTRATAETIDSLLRISAWFLKHIELSVIIERHHR